jgi:sulfur carrier protein ThiS
MNYDKYIGLPYLENGRTETGVDCWGLARLFYKDQFDIDLPSYSDEYDGGQDPAIISVVNAHIDNWKQLDTPNIGDLCLFNILGEPTHVGIYIGDNKFLHSREGMDSVVESLDSTKWKNRFQGFYKYTTQAQVAVVGAPHPLRMSTNLDWTVEGTTVQNLVDFVHNKYQVSKTLADKIVIVIDGIVVPQKDWATTVLRKDQQVSYKSIAEGSSTRRLLLIVAVMVVAYNFGPDVGKMLLPAGSSAQAISAVGTMAINMAGMALVNVIAPVRQPSSNDPGSANAINLFTGSSNQANKYGAIPVVLGKVRFTGMLGATPFVESLTDTSILNTAIVWGFGPLDISDICIGGNPIESFYEGLPSTTPRPVTLQGRPEESTKAFDNLYGKDVEQQFKNIELVNNITDGNPWTEVTLAQNADAIDIAFTFPEGMRKINTKDAKVSATTCQVEIQTRPFSTLPWESTTSSTSLGIYKNGNPDAATLDAAAYTAILTPPPIDPEQGTGTYLYSIFCLSPNGGVARFDGAVTDNLNANASAWIQDKYSSSSYSYLLGIDKNWNYLPTIPTGYLKLYTLYQDSQGAVTIVTNHVSAYTGIQGLTQTITAESTQSSDGVWVDSAIKKISISAGKVYSETATTVAPGATETIWDSRMITAIGTTVRTAGAWKGWNNVLKNTSVWSVAASDTFNHTENNVYFKYDGYYIVQACADDEGEIYIDGTKVVELPKGGYANYIQGSVKLSKGMHSITLVGRNSQGGDAAIGVAIGYTANSGLNIRASGNTIVTFGTPGFFELRKDAFNYVHSLENLPRGRYQIRVKRIDNDDPENQTDYRKYHKVALSTVTSYDSQEKPMINPPGCYLAKTAVRIQSTNKVNGTVDGLNALVQTITWDYDRDSSSWKYRPTNNPASLFAYVLMHPANAFRVTKTDQFDLNSIIAWHNFCNPIPQDVSSASLVVGKYYTIKTPGTTNWMAIGAGSNNVGEGFYATGTWTGGGIATYCPKYTYNSVLTSTQSVMDTLRDICAAGLASPSYIDGKWGVVIDKPRTYTTQHFTPHNSWGFESTKNLPILPHAFRITIPDESLAYQPNELIVYNYGYAATAVNGKKAATLFEQLSLPGVTNADQATRLARWHFAQIKLRPETYSLTVDFEQLVCTRGDLVKVTHDVPRWGTGSGRIKSVNGTAVTLTEAAYLEAGKPYTILIRTNNLNSSGAGSVTKTLAAITTSGYTNTITLASAITSGDAVEVDNLFMIGEINKTVQECIVLAVEPSTNYSAKLTLADYSPQIYTDDLSGLLVFNANITTVNTDLIKNSITLSPIITNVNSSSPLAEQISVGNYQNIAIASFSNPPNLPAIAVKVQFDIVRGEMLFNDESPSTTYIINKEASGITLNGLTSDASYKVRARYLDSTGKIAGPWSNVFTFLNDGKNTSTAIAPGLTMDLDHTFIVAKPAVVIQPSDNLSYEYRLYKDTGSEDFWELDTTDPIYNIKVIRSTEEARFDLRDQPAPRLSEAGVTYRVACRTVDRTSNYSAESTLGTIVVKTIT